MRWRDLPPLASLRAFAAYAETGNLQKAGAALGVSHAAISQSIRKLETHTGLTLLDRTGRSAQLTRDGQDLAETLRGSFADIAARLDALTGVADARPLVVSTTPSFATNWLVPHLAGFRDEHPEIDVVIDANPASVDVNAGHVDIALRFGRGTWAGLDAQLLIPTRRVAVASPIFLKEGAPQNPQELADFPLLQEIGTSESTSWLEQHGVCDAGKGGRVVLPGSTIIDAARAGQGILVTSSVWVEEDLTAGRLILLFEDDEDLGYHMVTRPGVPRAALKAFIAWLKKTAKARALAG